MYEKVVHGKCMEMIKKFIKWIDKKEIGTLRKDWTSSKEEKEEIRLESGPGVDPRNSMINPRKRM